LVFAYFRGIEWMRAEGIVGTAKKALALCRCSASSQWRS